MADETVTTAPADSPATAEPEPEDLLRQPLLDLLQAELGADLLGHELIPGDDLCVRVSRAVWRRTFEVLRDRAGLSYFCFLSGIDWKQNPALLGEKEWEPPEAEAPVPVADDSAPAPEPESLFEDDRVAGVAAPHDPTPELEEAEATDAEAQAAEAASSGYRTGIAGGDTRFQVFARVYNLATHVGITLKVDLPEDDPQVDSLVPLFRGADWHEREAWEMYGFNFPGHPKLRHLYLPGEFEGYPLRKDFPLLARLVKPWPGLVDVEPMPGEDPEAPEGDEG